MGRKEVFLKIKEEYSNFYKELMMDGKLPIGETKVGFWGTTITDDLFELFEKINLQKYKSFIDLGSGDGKAALVASLFTKASGIEFDKDLFEKSIEIRDKMGLKAELIKGDFLKHDISKHDIIFINPDKNFSEGTEAKLLKEMNGILIVYNIIYIPEKLKKGETLWSSNQIPSTIYTIPK